MAVLTATLKAVMVDAISGPAKRAGESLRGVERAVQAAGRGSSEINRLASALSGLGDKAGKLGVFREALAALSPARQRFREAQEAVQRLGREMASAESPSRQLAAAYRQAQTEVKAASRAFHDQKAAVLAAKGALEQAGIPARRAAQAQADLRRQIEATNAALRTQERSERANAVARIQSRQSAPGGSIASGQPGATGTMRDVADAAAGTAGVSAARAAYRRATAGWTEMDEAIRRQRAILSLSTDQQAPLKQQAFRIGQETRFSNADVVRGQTAIGGSLPDALKSPTVIAAITDAAKDYALAMGTTMEQGAEAVRSRMQTAGYDMSTDQAAVASSRRAANMLVQAAKLANMDHNDVMGYLRFGVAPGRVGGFSEAFHDSLAVNLRRVGIEGAMGGTFVRAAASRLSTPSRQARDALAAMNLRWEDYALGENNFSAGGFSNLVRTTFAKNLSDAARQRVQTILDDEGITSDRGRLQTELFDAISGEVGRRGRDGQMNAQDRERIAKMIDRFQLLSSQGTDTERLMTDILRRGMTPAVARYLFGQEHGGRAQTLNAAQVEADRRSMMNTPNNRAAAVGQEIQGGAYGAYQRMIGSIETFYTRLGEANDKLLTFAWDKIGNAFDSISNLSDRTLQFGTYLGLATSALLSFKAALAVKGLLGGAAGTAAGGAAAGAAARGGLMRFIPGVGYVAAAAAGGYAAGQAIDELGKITGGAYWTPRGEGEVADLRARATALEAEIAGIKSRTHPSMQGAANPQLANLESQLADINNRILAAMRERAPEMQAAGQQLGNSATAGVRSAEAAAREAGAAVGRAIVDGIRANAGTPSGSSASVPAGARANGGPVSAGRTYIVGERGIERFTPGQNGWITPNGGGGRLAASPSSGAVTQNNTFNVTVTGGGDAASIAAKVKEVMQAEVSKAMRGLQADYGPALA